MKKLFCFLIGLCTFLVSNAQVPEIEPNDNFSQSQTINLFEIASGNVTAVNDDYYRIVFTQDATIQIGGQATNVSATNGWINSKVYDKSGTEIRNWDFTGSSCCSNFSPNQTRVDTIQIHGRQADTLFIRFFTNQNFNYQWSYQLLNTSVNDVEPNGTFSSALLYNENQVKQGHIYYAYNGNVDANDYYRTVLPKNGTLKIKVKAKNVSGQNGYIYMKVFDGAFTEIANFDIGSSYCCSNMGPFQQRTDSILIYGRNSDTTYFRVYGNTAMQYELSYQMLDTSVVDAEPNNNVAQATLIQAGQIAKGQVYYAS
ncbi:MAG TPA: hypothetical protein PLU10_03920, partial [Chitinophagaceae bacterium]|nr:hypothetical protein [Chitinophagaceae bacterium]